MPGNIWILAEQWRANISEITYELLALGREVADQLGVPLEALLLGHNARALASTLGKADSVLYVGHPRLAEPVSDDYAWVLSRLLEQRKPHAFLIPLTNVSLGIGSLIGAQLRVPAVNFCKDIRVVDQRLQMTCVLYGGKIEAEVAAAGEPLIAGVWPGARPAEKGRAERTPAVEDLSLALPERPCARFKRYIEPEAGDVDITQQELLVAIGRGIQSQDNVALAQNLASALRGAVCGSRPVIDQGWLPLSRQVGKSGLTVKPKFYLALGISGAPEHVEGMKDAALIVAVNTDPRAPIFSVAHYGIVADALDFLPAFAAAIRGRRAMPSHA